jgi:hypothetical protein
MSASTWEDGLGDIEDEQDASKYAKEQVHEPLAEAHRRAKRVVELEEARPNPRPKVIENAQQQADILAQALGMWKH